MLYIGGTSCKPIPITSPFAIFTPFKQMILQSRSTAILYPIDSTNYWNALSNLAQIHQNLTDRADSFNISNIEWPQFGSLANHSHMLIESMSERLLNTLEVLPHPETCRLSRHKRDINVVPRHGLFQGIGKALSWLTGSLDSDTGEYININFNNVKRLRKAQG